MAQLASQSSLQYLIMEFSRASQNLHTNQWHRYDIAKQIFGAYGPAGLKELENHCSFKYSTLRKWVNTAQAFRPAQRAQYPELSPDTFAEARRAAQKFPSTSHASRPSYWLKKARDAHWNGRDLQAHVAQRLLLQQLSQDNAEESAQAALIRRGEQAQNRLHAIEAEIAEFNRTEAPYALVTLRLTKALYSPPPNEAQS